MKIRRPTLLVIILALGIGTACRASAENTPRQIGTLEGIQGPFSMAVEGNDLFVSGADHAVRVYSLDPFSFRFTIGGKGDGLHDFQFPPTLWVTVDFIAAADFVKSLWFSRTGEFIKAVNYSDSPDFDPYQGTMLFPAGDRYVQITSDHPDHKRTVALFDRDLQPIAILYEGLFDWNQAGGPNGFNPLNHRIEVAVGDGEIYVSDTDKGFFIRIFDLDGQTLATIDLTAKEAAIPVSATDRARLLEDIRLTRSESVFNFAKANLRIPDSFPRIHEIRHSDGRLYVTTHREKDGLHELLVLDTRGKVLDRLFLPMPSFHHFRGAVRSDLFDVSSGALTELAQNPETEVWEAFQTVLSKK